MAQSEVHDRQEAPRGWHAEPHLNSTKLGDAEPTVQWVAPAPEIGLQDLKVRCTSNNKNKTCVSRNSSNSSSGSDRRRTSHHGFRQMVRGCKCSVETVPFDIMITKSTKKTESTTTHAMKEKAKQKQKKKAMSRLRTFEWIKELSHAGYGYNNDEEETLLLNS